MVEVTADDETEPVTNAEDAADDPAIWIHSMNPSKSKIIGTNKENGVVVYDLDGNKLYAYDFGEINNIDVRYQFQLGNEKIDIAAATNRSTNTIDIFSIDPDSGELTYVAGDPIKSNMDEVYGFSLYNSQKTGKFYALVVGKEGLFEQYDLFDNGNGRIDGKMVRNFKLGSQAEGIVADDEYGTMYIGEETVAIWKYNAEPNSSSNPIAMVDSTN